METHAFIYKIFCPDGDEGDVYYGSSTNKRVNDRFVGHKVHFRNWKEGKKTHMTSFNLFEKYGVNNCVIEKVEDVVYTDKSTLVERERFYIDNNKCINIQLPGRTRKQYAEDNKEHRKIKANENKIKNWDIIQPKKKAYRDSHKEEYREYCLKNKEKFQTPVHCECGSICTSRNYSTHIKTQLHLDFIKTGIQKPETIPLNEVINCECGKQYTHSNRIRHKKSQKHLAYLKTLENIPL